MLFRSRSNDSVVGIVTQPDRPKGRGQTLTPSPVKLLAQRAQIPLLQPLKMKDPEFLHTLAGWKPDLIVVSAFGRILPPTILSLPPRGCINVHGSLLPKYRGAGPIQWAIMNGEKETGITTMLMDVGMDTGAMLLQEAIPIMPDDTAGTLSPRLAELGGKLLAETIIRLKAGTLVPQPQDASQATLAPLLTKEDGAIDWTLPAMVLANRVRAAGMRTEPPVSVPSPPGAIPAAMAAAVPPLDPPGNRARSYGLRTGPKVALLLVAPKAGSCMLFLPSTIAPASIKVSTTRAVVSVACLAFAQRRRHAPQ